MGRRRYWAGVAGMALVSSVFTYSIIFLPRDIIKSRPARTLEGVVVEESYVPSRRFMGVEEYHLSFNDKTAGKVSVRILPGIRSIGSIDVMVQQGTRLNVNAYEFSPGVYTAYADEVRFLPQDH